MIESQKIIIGKYTKPKKKLEKKDLVGRKNNELLIK